MQARNKLLVNWMDYILVLNQLINDFFSNLPPSMLLVDLLEFGDPSSVVASTSRLLALPRRSKLLKRAHRGGGGKVHAYGDAEAAMLTCHKQPPWQVR